MVFNCLRIKEVDSVHHYEPSVRHWKAQNRKNHFIGVQLRGSAIHRFDHKSFVLSRNTVYFFNRIEDYEVEVLEDTESFSVHFTTYEEIGTESFCVAVENSDEFIALLQKAETLSKLKGREDLDLLATLYKLCSLLSHMREKAYAPRNDRMLAAREYIDLHFTERCCLANAIREAGLSSRRFNDLFKVAFDTTPNRYLSLRRIEHAKSLLEMKSLRIADIALLCGFTDVYYFSKAFKQICGVPPSKWT